MNTFGQLKEDPYMTLNNQSNIFTETDEKDIITPALRSSSLKIMARVSEMVKHNNIQPKQPQLDNKKSSMMSSKRSSMRIDNAQSFAAKFE